MLTCEQCGAQFDAAMSKLISTGGMATTICGSCADKIAMEHVRERHMRAFEMVYRVYRWVDEVTLKVRDEMERKGRPVHCGLQDGCYGCCHQWVLVTKLEAQALADAVVRMEGRRGVVDGLLGQAHYECSLSAKDYFQRPTRCALLTRDNACALYSMRPTSCRTLLCLDDYKTCFPVALGGPEAEQISLVNMTRVKLAAFEQMKHIEVGPQYAAPLALAVLRELTTFVSATQRDYIATQADEMKLPTPEKWWRENRERY